MPREPHPEKSEPDPSDLPELYASTCRGDCLEPHFCDGDCLVFSRKDEAQAGDFVGVWLRPHDKPDAKVIRWVKRLAMGYLPGTTFPFELAPGSEVEPIIILEMFRPPKLYQIPARDILAMHKVIGKARSNGDGTASVPKRLIAAS